MPSAWTEKSVHPGPSPPMCAPRSFAVFAGILPEGKYNLVKAFQKSGHTVGMCGDGANDAPALRQAQMGIAVSTATDVAKSAAGIVLTKPGLGGIVASVKEGRVTFQRILTYTLNSVTKKIVQVLFLAVGLVMTGHAILTPMLMVIIMLTGDLLGMSLTTDNVRPSPTAQCLANRRIDDRGCLHGSLRAGLLHRRPGRRQIPPGFWNRNAAEPWPSWSSCSAIKRRPIRIANAGVWGPARPSRWLIGSSVVDLLIASTLAICGIAMAPLPIFVVGGTLVAAAVFRIHRGFCQSPRVSTPQDRIARDWRVCAPGQRNSCCPPVVIFGPPKCSPHSPEGPRGINNLRCINSRPLEVFFWAL